MNRREIVSFARRCGRSSARTAALAQTSSGRPRRVGLMIATGENDPEGKLRVETFIRVARRSGVGRRARCHRRCRVVSRQLPGGPDRWPRTSSIAAPRCSSSTARPAWTRCGAWAIGLEHTRSSLSSSAIRSARATCRTCRGRAATSPASARSSRRWPAKWLQLLKEVAPGLQNVSMLLDRKFIGFNSLLEAVQNIGALARHRRPRRLGQLAGRHRARTSRRSPSRPRPD